MSYIINFELYQNQLESNDGDLIKEALQRIFELLTKGYSFSRPHTLKFLKILEKCVLSHVPKVRKWAYHCACFYSTNDIRKKCKKKLNIEKSPENILWNISSLSVNCRDLEELRNHISKRKYEEFRESISPDVLVLSSLLFTDMVEPTNYIKKFYNSDKRSEIMIIEKMYGYPYLSHKKNYDNWLNEEKIISLQEHDDPLVREYAFWALFKNGKALTNFKSIKDDLNDNLDILKWKYAVFIAESEKDFVTEVLNSMRYPEKMEHQIKEGIINGLYKLDYDINYVDGIARWYSLESDKLIQQLLLNYIVKFCSENKKDGTFFELLKSEFTENSSIEMIQNIKRLIRNYPESGLEINENFNRLQWKKENNEMSKKNKSIYNFNGSVINSTIDTKVDKGNFINNNSVGVSKDMESLIELIRDTKEEIFQNTKDEELKNTINDVENALVKNDVGLKEKLSKLLNLLADASTVASATPVFISVCNKMISGINNLIKLI
ncbi:MAG: hypothetical protein EUB_02694 [Eubacterium sp.]|uniref:hypothetical protein n=1 Tax=Eubacterium sp. TaxID=142586 RepID=UPI003046B9C0